MSKPDSQAMEFKVQIVSAIAEIGADDWDRCANPQCPETAAPYDPFISFDFLHAKTIWSVTPKQSPICQNKTSS